MPTRQATVSNPARKQRLFITGGTGFIGTALCRSLLAQGHTLTLLARNPAKVAALFGPSVPSVARCADLPDDCVFDSIINLAGAPVVGPRWSAARKAALLESRVGVTNALQAWIARAQHKPRLLISGSAIGYYGVQDRHDKAALGEDAPPQKIFMSTLCQEWEASASAAHAHGVAVALLRLGVVLGPLHGGQGALPQMVMPVRMGLNGRLGDGQQIVSWIHRDDVLAAIDFLLAQGAAAGVQSYNLTAPTPCTQSALIAAAANAMGRRFALPLAAPAGVLRLLMGAQAELLLEGQRVVPTRLLEAGFVFRHPTLDTALRACIAGA